MLPSTLKDTCPDLGGVTLLILSDNGIHSAVHADAKTIDVIGMGHEDEDEDDDDRNTPAGPTTSIKAKTKHPATTGDDIVLFFIVCVAVCS